MKTTPEFYLENGTDVETEVERLEAVDTKPLRRPSSMPSLTKLFEEEEEDQHRKSCPPARGHCSTVTDLSRRKSGVFHKCSSAGVMSDLVVSSEVDADKEDDENDVVMDETIDGCPSFKRSLSLLSIFQSNGTKEEKARRGILVAKKCPRYETRRNALHDPEKMAMSQDVRERVEKERALRTASITRKVSLVFRAILDDEEVDLV